MKISFGFNKIAITAMMLVVKTNGGRFGLP